MTTNLANATHLLVAEVSVTQAVPAATISVGSNAGRENPRMIEATPMAKPRVSPTDRRAAQFEAGACRDKTGDVGLLRAR